MNCKTFAATLYDYLDGALTASQEAEFQLHRSGCTKCADRVELEIRTARAVRAAIEEECAGLEFSMAKGRRLARPLRRRWSLPAARWPVAAAVVGLLLVVLLLPPLVRGPAQGIAPSGKRWTQEVEVTYENGLVAETILVSHDSGHEEIIEMRVTYYP